jgi:hypothetical protein
MRTLTDAVTLRHLGKQDIPRRIEALSDPMVHRNISGLPQLYDEGALTHYFMDIVEGRNPTRIEFVLSKHDGTVVGYTYLLGVDLPNRTCEIGMITLPRFRFGFGLVAMVKTYEYAFGVLNMRSVLNEVYDGNSMMSTSDLVTRRAQVTATAGQFTDGQVRDSYFWTETRTDFPVHFGRYLQARAETMS